MAATEGVTHTNEMSATRRVVREDAGRGSSSSAQPVAIVDERELSHVVIQSDISPTEEWLNSIKNWGNNTSQKHKIQEVPQMLRQIESNKKCYDPLVVSIGPYHHGKPAFERLEKFKFPLTQDYAERCEGSIYELYAKVAAVASEARNCYADCSTECFSDDDFTKMMFLDGCFILQFIYCIEMNKPSELKMKNHDKAFIQRDLFLLENQLPFQVLKALMSIKFKKDEGEGLRMINKFVSKSMGPTAAQKMITENEEGSKNPPIHLLDLMWRQLINIKAFEDLGKSSKNGNDWYSYRSVQELKAAGIHFRPSRTHCFTDVEYQNQHIRAILRLPAITVDDSTKSLLLNLVAYETCPGGPDNFGVTSYLWFMDSLIDCAEDVKELRRKGILLNFLGSDQHVAELFNEIATDLVPNPDAYVNVKEQIEKHYKSKCKVWFTEWVHTHFSSPWTILAFIGALFVLGLGVIQTFFPRKDQW